MSQTVTQNPELYARMAEPYLAREEAASALDAFLGDVRAAREKHRVAEVLVVTAAHYVDGDTRMVMVQSISIGNSAYSAELAAIGF